MTLMVIAIIVPTVYTGCNKSVDGGQYPVTAQFFSQPNVNVILLEK